MNTITSTRSRLPPIGFGLSSVTLGAIGLLMFFLPILSLPISGAGAFVGLIGVWVAVYGGREKLRLSIAGLLLALCAQGIVWGIAIAPSGYFTPRSVFPAWEPIRGRPYVPPPAPSRGGIHELSTTIPSS